LLYSLVKNILSLFPNLEIDPFFFDKLHKKAYNKERRYLS